MLRFEEWLAVQQDRADVVGELARVLAMQKRDQQSPTCGSAADEHRVWANIVVRLPQPGHIETFNEAWQEFLRAKQAAIEATEGDAGKKAPRRS